MESRLHCASILLLSDWWRCMWKSRQFILWNRFDTTLTSRASNWQFSSAENLQVRMLFFMLHLNCKYRKTFPRSHLYDTIMVEAINCARSKSSEDISLLSYEIIHWISPSHISIGPGHFHPRTHMVAELFHARKSRSLLWGDKNTCTRPHKACLRLIERIYEAAPPIYCISSAPPRRVSISAWRRPKGWTDKRLYPLE